MAHHVRAQFFVRASNSSRSRVKVRQLCMVAPLLVGMGESLNPRRSLHGSGNTGGGGSRSQSPHDAHHKPLKVGVLPTQRDQMSSSSSSFSTKANLPMTSSITSSPSSVSSYSSSFATDATTATTTTTSTTAAAAAHTEPNLQKKRKKPVVNFGGANGTCIENKDTILSEVDKALGLHRPPDLEVFAHVL
jgi:hypothetical protein